MNAILLMLPMIIVGLVISLLRSQRDSAGEAQRRREIMRELSQQYGQPRPRQTPPAAQRPPATPQRPPTGHHPPARAMRARPGPQQYVDPNSTYVRIEEYTKDFQSAYYRAQDRGRDLDPWDLPPEKAPWER